MTDHVLTAACKTASHPCTSLVDLCDCSSQYNSQGVEVHILLKSELRLIYKNKHMFFREVWFLYIYGYGLFPKSGSFIHQHFLLSIIMVFVHTRNAPASRFDRTSPDRITQPCYAKNKNTLNPPMLCKKENAAFPHIAQRAF